MTDISSTTLFEEALTKAEALINEGKLKEADLALQAVLAAGPRNEKALKLKEELEKRQSLMGTSKSSTGSSNVQTSSLNCPSCGAAIVQLSSQSEAITCTSCGAVIDLESDGLQVLSQLTPSNFESEGILKLGLKGTLNGKKYQIIGRICYSASIKEWDVEDGCYCTEPWSFDEWTLVGENKEYIHIYQDKEGYAVSTPFVPTAPKIPEENEKYLTLDKDAAPRIISEWTYARIEYFEGEFTWAPRVGELARGAEYPFSGSINASVEWRLAEDNKTPVEVEFFKSIPISKLELAIAFELREIIEEEEAKKRKKEEYKKWSYAFFAAAGVCALLLFFSFAQSGKKIAAFDIGVLAIGETGAIRGPVELDKKGTIYNIALQSSIPDNSSAWVGVELLDNKQEAINAIEEEFWRESGYDADGSWSESNTSKDYFFRLDSPGTYYLRFFSEGGPSSGTVSAAVFEGVTLSRWYLLAMLFCLGYGYALRKHQSINPWFIILGILVIAFFILSHMGDSD